MKSIISKDIQKAIALLQNEDIVAIPTETVYGLAGNIFSEKAIQKIFDTKKRPSFNPLIVHIGSFDDLQKVVRYVPEKAMLLAKHFWPGSLTLVLPKKDQIPDVVTAGKDTVGVRMPNHPLTLTLLSKLDFPIAAPSANPFNSISPTKAEHVANYFKDTISMVLDGGTCKKGLESTIIGFENDEPIVYRLGAIAIEEIENVVGKVKVKNNKEHQPDAPGMLAKHYAPKTKTILSDDISKSILEFGDKKIGVLTFGSQKLIRKIVIHYVLSKNNDLHEAASNLYTMLHLLDNNNLDVIIVEMMPNYGLGRTINDRLKRASSSI